MATAVPEVPAWAWGTLAPGASPTALAAQLNLRMRQLEPVLRGLGAGVDAAVAAGGVDATLRGYFDAAGRLVTGLGAGADVAGTPALTVARASAILFREPFDALPAGWRRPEGAGTLQIVTTGGVTGGRTLRATGPVWLIYPFGLAFDPGTLYRLATRVRQVTRGTGGQPVTYVGLAGAADPGGQIYVNVTGANAYGNQHYVACAEGLPVGPAWQERQGWVRGNSTGAGQASPAPDPRTPGQLQAAVRYVLPVVILNFGGGPDAVAEIDMVELAAYDRDAATRLYTGLDPAGRVQTGVNPTADIGGRLASTLAGAIDAAGRATSLAPGVALAQLVANGQRPIETVSALPPASTPGRFVYLTSDGKLYRDTGVGWTRATDARDLTFLDQLVAGSINASAISATALSAISANLGVVTAGRLGNAADTAGILLSGARPASWTQFLDFTATGAQPTLALGQLAAYADGSATFGGEITSSATVRANSFYADTARFAGQLTLARGPAAGVRFEDRALFGDAAEVASVRARRDLYALPTGLAHLVLSAPGGAPAGTIVGLAGEGLGFYGTAPIARLTVSQPRNNAGFLSQALLAVLSQLGLCVDACY